MSAPTNLIPYKTSLISAELARIASSEYDACAVFTNPHQNDNPIVYATRAFFRYTGYRPHEVIGQNCRFLQGPDTDPVSVARIRDALASETELDLVLVNYRRDGMPFLNRLRIRPLYDRDGRLHRFAGYQKPVGRLRDRTPPAVLPSALPGEDRGAPAQTASGIGNRP